MLTPPVLASYFQDEIVRRLQGSMTFSTAALGAVAAASNTPTTKRVDNLMPTFSPLNELSGFVDYSGREDSTDTTERKNALMSIRTPSRYFCPATLSAVFLSIGQFFVSLYWTDWETVGIQIEVIFIRSVYALWYRKKLIVASITLHVLLACFLGWVLGPSSDQIYNLTSFFAISTLMIFFANLQCVSFIFTSHKVCLLALFNSSHHLFCFDACLVGCFDCFFCIVLVCQVFLKEHSRGLYSTVLYWFYSQFPIYVLKTVCALLFAVISYTLLDMESSLGTKTASGFVACCLLFSTLYVAFVFLPPNVEYTALYDAVLTYHRLPHNMKLLMYWFPVFDYCRFGRFLYSLYILYGYCWWYGRRIRCIFYW